MKLIALIILLKSLTLPAIAQPLQCPTQKQISVLENQILASTQASNDLTQIALEASQRNQLSAALAVGSGTLMISSSLAAYYFSLNPGLIGSVVTFFRLPTGVAGATAGLAISEALKLSAISTTLSNSVVVVISTAAAHLESVYLISQGLYQLTTPHQKVAFTNSDLLTSQSLVQKALNETAREIQNLLENPPGSLQNSLRLGRPNSQHFQKLSELAQLRVVLLKELKDQMQLQIALCEK